MAGSTFAHSRKSDPIITDDQLDGILRQAESNPPMGRLRMAGTITEGFSYNVKQLFSQRGCDE
jgi:hypothetical protein